MAGLAQLVRAPGCGSGGRGFDPHSSPQTKSLTEVGVFVWVNNVTNSKCEHGLKGLQIHCKYKHYMV